VAASFVGFEITWQADVFSDAPQASSAADFGTLGINFRARKAFDDAEWNAALEALACDVPAQAKDEEQMVSILGADAFYDAGEKGCAEGPLDEIAVLVGRLSTGQTLEVRATDPSVAADLPAWCRLARHEIVKHQADRYLIRRS
jgi:tRNA 2-thiouridine synthesizing protein A